MAARKDKKPSLISALQTVILHAVILAASLALPHAIFPAEEPAEELPTDNAEMTVEKVTEDAAKKAVEKAVQAAEKAAGKAAQETTEKAVEKAAEKAVEKAVEKAAEDAAEKAELKAIRPDERSGPTKVHFLLFVLDVDQIDDANQSFNANVYIRLRWQDRRLVKAGGSTQQISLDQVWNPRLVLVNQSGQVSRALPEVVQVDPDGTVVYYQRYTGKMSQALNLSNFPLDSHTFTIQFASAGYSANDLEFVPDVGRGWVGGSMAKELSIPDWKVVKYEALTLPYQPIETARAEGFVFRFEAARYIPYYLWQVVLPLAVVVLMSWAAFWIGRDNVGVRVGVATSSILTLIAQRFVVANLLPRLPYMTRLDYFTAGSTLLVLIALMVVVWTSYLATHNDRHVAARRIDLSARVAFPAAYFLLLVWFILG